MLIILDGYKGNVSEKFYRKRERKMTESVAYMSENGVLFKEMPPNPMFELTPLYKLRDVSDKEIEELASFIFTEDRAYEYCDVYKFAKALLQKAREK